MANRSVAGDVTIRLVRPVHRYVGRPDPRSAMTASRPGRHTVLFTLVYVLVLSEHTAGRIRPAQSLRPRSHGAKASSPVAGRAGVGRAQAFWPNDPAPTEPHSGNTNIKR